MPKWGGRFQNEGTQVEPMHVFRIVLASPGDVQPERDAVEPLVADLNRMFREAETHVLLVLSRWETDAFPGLHQEGPQALIDQSLDIEESDLLVGIFRKRFGTPVNDAGSGTEHEIRRAIHSFRSKGTPQVMLYFGEVTDEVQPPEPDEQWRRVNEFKQDMMAKEKALIWTYRDLPHFRTLLQIHLFKFVMQLERKRMQRAGMPLPGLRVSWKPEVVQLRSEGYTELLGNWFLYCTYEGSGVPERILHLGVIVFLNTAITSRPADPVLFEVGRPGADSLIPCTDVHGNMVIFASVPLQGIMPRETRVFQISNLRCNATSLSPGSATTFNPVIAFVSVTGTQIDQDAQEVARVSNSLKFEIRNLDRAPRTYRQSHSLPPTGVAMLRFTQRFPGAFKGRLPGNYSVHDGTFAHSGESCRFGSLFESRDSSIRSRGTADHGTRLQAVFTNVPAGLRLFVSVCSKTGLSANLVEIESSLVLDTTPRIISDLEARELHIEQGSARVVWEVSNPDDWPSGVDPIDFVVSAAYEAEPLQNRPMLGIATVNGGFAPSPPAFSASAGAASSPSLPIPRFVSPWDAAINLLQIIFE